MKSLSIFSLLSLFVVLATGCGSRPAAETAAVASVRAASASVASLDAASPLPADPDVAVGTLPNGLTYYVRENRQPERRASLFLVVAAGSVDEDDDQLGLAHMAEHMAFNGTEHFPKQALIDYLESIGMAFGPEINAFTSFDQTVYMLQVPTDDERLLATGLQILENWAHRVSFDDEEIDLERGVIVEEWRVGLSAARRIRDRQLPVIFHGSRYADRNVIGDMDIIRNHEHDTIRRYYRDWYRPSLQAIVAVGDFDQQKMIAKIGEAFAALRDPQPARARVLAPMPEHAELLASVVTDPEATRTEVGMSWKSPPRETATLGDLRRQLALGLGLDMLSSRLQELAREADPPFTIAFANYRRQTRTSSVLSLSAVAPENGAARALTVLAAEAERVRRHGFGDAELERARLRVLRSAQRQVEEKETTESRNWSFQYMQHYLYGGPLLGRDDQLRLYEALLPGIGAAEVEAELLALLTEHNRVVTVSGPQRDDLGYPTETGIAAIVAAAAAQPLDPYGDESIAAPLVADPPAPAAIVGRAHDPVLDTTTWTLANGVRVVLKPTLFKNDEVLMRAYQWGGASVLADAEQRRLAGLAAGAVAQSGVGDFDPVALQRLLAGKVVSSLPSLESLATGFQGSASPRDLETLLQLVWLQATAPRLDAQAFASWQHRTRTWLQGRDADPMTALRDTLQSLLYAGAPEYRPLTVADLESIELPAAMSYYRQMTADFSQAVFFFVGNLTLAEFEPLVRTYLGNLPAAGREHRWHDRSVPTAAGVHAATVRKGLDPKGYVQIVLSGDAVWSPQEEYALESLLACLRIRLRQVVREELSGTYGVRVGGGLQRVPRETFRVDIGWGCDPERVPELTMAVRDVIAEMAAQGPDAETLEKVRETQARSDETDLRTNRHWLRHLVQSDQSGQDPQSILLRSHDIAELTAATVREAAARYLTAGNEVRVVLLPEGEPRP